MPVAPASRIWARAIGSCGPNQRQACSIAMISIAPARPGSLFPSGSPEILGGGAALNFIGIDIGTSAVKGVLVDERQAILAEASAPVQSRQPRPGWSEQDPEEWWRATESVVASLRSSALGDFGAISAI